MKTKMKKKCVKILTLIICMVSLVSALLIAPSADSYTDNFSHYWFYFDSSAGVTVPADGVATFQLEVRSGRRSRITYIYDREGANNKFDFWYVEHYDILFAITKGAFSDGTPYLESRCEIRDVSDEYGPIDGPRITITKYYNSNGECERMNIQTYRMEHAVYLDWEPSYGNYNLQIWLDLNSIQNIGSQLTIPSHYANFADVVQACCRYNLISTPKQYSEGVEVGFEQGYNKGYDEGYVEGNDIGYHNGFGDGYDQGNIDGIQQGLTEGYNEGYDDGYSIGNEEGYSDGYDYGYFDGEKYGWDNGFGAGQNDMAETSHTFKEMVFAIFDAPSRLIDSMLNFDIFGINLAGLVKTLITLAVVAVILFILLKWLL